MAILKTFRKTATEYLDFTIDWTKWLPTGDTITSSSWTVPSGITNGMETNTTILASIWLSSGTLGTTYDLVNSIKTSLGRQADRTIAVQITPVAVDKTFFKDPGAALDYTVDWSRWMPSGDAIASVDWTVDDGIFDAKETNDDDSSTIWLSSGTAGTTYKIVAQITTDDTRIAERAFEVNIIDR
jgi:hypothetical protein